MNGRFRLHRPRPVKRKRGATDALSGCCVSPLLSDLAELSMEQLVEVYKKVLEQLHRQSEQRDMDLIVTMVPNSVTSGEIKGYFKKPDTDLENSILVDYRHYYILNAIREKMMVFVGDGWSKVKATYRSDQLEFHFDY